MASLSQAKMLGGIGSILTLLLFVPFYIGAVLVVVGWILILVALKNISDTVQEGSIFSNALISAVLAIIGTIVFAVVVASAVLGFIGLGVFSGGSVTPGPGLFALLGAVVLGLVVVWTLAIVSSFFLYRSFKSVAGRLNTGWFRTAGLLYFIGSFLTIIFVGFILIFVAQIIFAVAFFSLPENPPMTPASQPQMMGAPPTPPP